MAHETDAAKTAIEAVRPLEPDERGRFVDAGVDPSRLESTGIDPAGVVEKEYSYRQLVDGGLSEDDAGALRRTFSLPWSFETDGNLDDRSEAVSGLGDDERAWVAASADESWQGFDGAGERSIPTTTDRPAERPYPRPTPVTAVTGVSEANADRLADAGVVSAERLATIHAGEVASALDLDVLHVRTWRHNARELVRR
ncbi:hypothetical protein [Halovivax cerinus]|uniref:Helix-hairpin-helix domain-containing protein n=1 Tax=Halovivax cerinus TaxID=1487865 RepID=A0ABD5NK16_9EURY|nr:hypothetical protein [Halovivax cerinus]